MRLTSPLKLWVITIAILVFIGVGMDFYRADLRSMLLNKPIEIAFEKAPDDGDVKVVLICSSLGKHGLSDPPELKKFASHNEEGLDYTFVKIPRRAGKLQDFTRNDVLIDKINEFEPDYLILQESLAFFEGTPAFSMRNFGFQKDILLSMHIKAILLGTDRVYSRTLKNGHRKFDPNFDTIQVVNQKAFFKESVRSDSEVLIDFASKLKTKIVILHIPLTSPNEVKMDSIRKNREFITLFEKEKSIINFTYFHFEKPLPFKYYHDENHLNVDGEKIYSEWFVKKLHQFHLTQIENDK